MNQFWDQVLAPTIAALKPRIILQIGAKDERVTISLVEAAIRIGATVHIASLRPLSNIAELRRQGGDHVILHPGRGHEVVPLLPNADLVLIDDDPNWYSVHGLLQALDRKAAQSAADFPVVALVQTGWPYGRRDSYDDPSAIPGAWRQPYEQAGLMPGSPALGASSGLFADRCNAREENAAHSGVLTALEDFLIERPGRFATVSTPIFHGLTLVRPAEGAAAALLGPVWSSLSLGAGAAALTAALETARVEAECRLAASLESRRQADYRNEALQEALRSKRLEKLVSVPMALKLPALDGQRAFKIPRALVHRARPFAYRLRRAVARRFGYILTRDRKLAAEIERLRSSALFDAQWYVARYAGVVGTMDPVRHYVMLGRELGLDPGPDFSAGYYLSTYPDVADAALNPLLHYLTSGASEGRDPSPTFRTRDYLSMYPEVGETGQNPFEHYVRYGRGEGRRPAATYG